MTPPKTARTTLLGLARDAKGGAVLVTDTGDPVYLEGLDAWPPELLGKRVRATGRLAQKKYSPDPVVDKTGAISQGAEGMQTVLMGPHVLGEAPSFRPNPAPGAAQRR